MDHLHRPKNQRKRKTSYEGLGISKHTLDRLLREKRPADLIALLMFYHYTGLWQETNRPHATVGFVMKGLGWGIDKVRSVRSALKELGLIEDVAPADRHGRKTRWYVRVAYFHPLHPTDQPEGGSSQRVASTPPNALRASNGNALRANKKTRTTATRSASAHRAAVSLEEFEEGEREIIMLYNQTLCRNGSGWKPVDRFTPAVRDALANWFAPYRNSEPRHLRRLFRAVANGNEGVTIPQTRTLTRLLYDNPPDTLEFPSD